MTAEAVTNVTVVEDLPSMAENCRNSMAVGGWVLPLLLVSLCRSVCGSTHKQYSLYVDVLCHHSLTSDFGVASSSSPSPSCLSMSTSIKIFVALSQHHTVTQNFPSWFSSANTSVYHLHIPRPLLMGASFFQETPLTQNVNVAKQAVYHGVKWRLV